MSDKIKNLHVFKVDEHDKFMPDFIRFCRKELPDTDNLYYAINAEGREFYQSASDCVVQGSSNLSYLNLIPLLYRAERIILHGLFDPKLIVLLAFNPRVLKKSYWVIWGGDLYQYKSKDATWRSKLKEHFRRSVLRRISYIVAGAQGDVDFARQWYGVQAKHIECNSYASNIFAGDYTYEPNSNEDKRILLGNSGDPSNRHLEMLEKLEGVDGIERFDIYSPLSYGDPEYIQQVVQIGLKKFGNRFKPITSFIEKNEYLSFLSSIDVAVFNHSRQQALGNSVLLLGMGKKVYLSRESILNEFFSRREIKIFHTENISSDLFAWDSCCAANNVESVKKNFSAVALSESLKKWL